MGDQEGDLWAEGTPRAIPSEAEPCHSPKPAVQPPSKQKFVVSAQHLPASTSHRPPTSVTLFLRPSWSSVWTAYSPHCLPNCTSIQPHGRYNLTNRISTDVAGWLNLWYKHYYNTASDVECNWKDFAALWLQRWAASKIRRTGGKCCPALFSKFVPSWLLD